MPPYSLSDGSVSGYFGVYPAIVTNIVDEKSLGRIEVRFPSLGRDGDRNVRAWATLCSPYADKDQGLQVLPEVDSQVLVAFEAGNFRRPYVIGAAWNGTAPSPRRPNRDNNIRVLRSRNGSEIEFDDSAGAEKVSITMGTGHKVVMNNLPPTITIHHTNGCEIQIDVAGKVSIKANLSMDVTAPMVNVTSPIAKFTGVVKCKTLIADTAVASPVYTPGIGNIL